MMKRKIILLLLVILCMVLTSFTACSSTTSDNKSSSSSNRDSETNSGSSSSSATEPSSEVTSNGKITDENITLSMWVVPDAKVTASLQNYGEIAMYKELEKVTGIDIDWIHPSAEQSAEQFNLLIASEDYPDMINHSWPTVAGGPAKYINDGIIIDLSPLMEDNAPNIMSLYSEHPEWRKSAVLDDGTHYMIPFIRNDLFVTLGNGFQLRKDWLDKLNLEVPTTIAETYEVLKAFKDNDVNGTGNVAPFSSIGAGGVMNFSYAYGVTPSFMNKSGTVLYGPMQPEYKEFLEEMRKWYAEGLIYPEYLTTDSSKFDQLVTGDIAGSYFGMLSGSMGKYLDLVKPTNPEFDLVGAPYLTGPHGDHYSYLQPPGPQQYGSTVITTACEYPELALQWIDYHFSEEGQMLTNFGVEGLSYDLVGGVPKFNDNVLKDPDGLPVTSALCKYNTLPISFISLFKGEGWEQVLTYQQQVDAIAAWESTYDATILMPNVTLTSEEAKQMSNILADINKYVEEISNKIIMGQEPISKYDEMINNLKNMRIDDAINIYQDALERYNNR